MRTTGLVGWRQVAVAATIVAVGLVVSWASPARSQSAGPLDTYAFVARADNPVDALAAAAVAGQLGAPVFLTGTSALGEQARQGLVDAAPDVVVLAGGTVALSDAVQDQIGALLPDAQLRRFAGSDRTETARLVNELTGQLGVERPVVAGATVVGDVGIEGALTVDGTDVGAALAALSARTDALEADLAAAQGRIGELESTLAGVARDGDTLLLSGMNLQLVNGQGRTDSTNGLGNLVIGYNAQRTPAATRAGSHYLIVGDRHEWTAHAGIAAGFNHTVTAERAAVTGGQSNTASGSGASVTGGSANTASGIAASVTGGQSNTASGAYASVTGGQENTASGPRSVVAGGSSNTAGGGYFASVAGGASNTASGYATSVAGGLNGTVGNSYDSLIGNTAEPDG